MYFKDEYNEYYDALSAGADSMKASIAGMQDSITEVSNQFNSISLMLNEMRGEFSLELASGIDGLLDEVNGLKGIIDSGLSSAVNTMNDLGQNLNTLKPEDEEYENKVTEYEEESNKSINQYETDANGNKVESEQYKNWKHNLDELSKSIKQLAELCQQLQTQTQCDNDINLIEQFNNSVIDLRLKLAAVASSMGDNPIEDIDKMTPQEKQEYLETLLASINEKYNEYKELYEYYSRDYIKENCTDDELYNFVDIFDQLLGDIPECPSLFAALDSKNPITRGNSILNIVEMLTNPEKGVNGKDILSIVKDYANGASWKDSGMDEIYRRNENNSLQSALNRGEDAESLFWSRATYGDPSYNKEMLDNFLRVTDVLDKAKDGFAENYNKALNSAMVIKGLNGLKDSLIYDYTSKTPDYEQYNTNLDVLLNNGFIPEEYTLDECKMLSYLLENKGYKEAQDFLTFRQDSINRRNGMMAAQEYYDSLHNGNNAGVDALVDHLSVGATGFTDGLGSFADGLIDIIAPDKTMSASEYESMYLLQKLEDSNDPYDKSLLTDYKITNTVGVYTIPTVVGAVTGGSAGTALFIASDIGNATEANLQQSFRDKMDYNSITLEQASHAEAFINAAVPYIGTDIPNDATAAIVGAFTDINPVLGAALDVAFDQVYKYRILDE
jgi:hypothetical protein